jgi:hypothetical protein
LNPTAPVAESANPTPDNPTPTNLQPTAPSAAQDAARTRQRPGWDAGRPTSVEISDQDSNDDEEQD